MELDLNKYTPDYKEIEVGTQDQEFALEKILRDFPASNFSKVFDTKYEL